MSKYEISIEEEYITLSLYRDSRIRDILQRSLSYLIRNQRNYLDEKENEEFLLDAYYPTEIIKHLTSNQISKLNIFLNQIPKGVSLEAFILIFLNIFSLHNTNHIHALINGVRELFELICQHCNCTRIKFQDFVNFFVSQELLIDAKIDYLTEMENKTSLYRFKLTENQDTVYHTQPIKIIEFSNNLNLIFSLDDSSNSINLYNKELKFLKKINPDKLKHVVFPVHILNLFWSEKQKNIAVCLQDFSLSFWNFETDFEKEYSFFTDCIQLKIFFIDKIDKWFTISNSNQLIKWDIEKGIEEIIPVKFRGKISDCIELTNLNLLAISSYDKKLLLWNFETNQIFMMIELPSSAHTIKYSYKLGFLISSGFEKTLNFWHIDITKDYTLMHQIEAGYKASISSFEIFDDINLLISIDEKGHLRSWNLINFSLIQSFALPSRYSSQKIIRLDMRNFCVIGSRIYLFRLQKEKNKKKEEIILDENKGKFIKRIEYDSERQFIYMGTDSELFVINFSNAKLQNRFNNDNSNIQDKIQNFRYSNIQSKLFFANTRGIVSQLISKSSIFQEKEKYYDKINDFLLDDYNNLIVCWNERKIKILDYDHDKKFCVIRSLKFDFKEKKNAQICINKVYLNVILDFMFIWMSNNIIIIISYHNLQILSQYSILKEDLEEKYEIIGLDFLINNGICFYLDNNYNINFENFNIKTFDNRSIYSINLKTNFDKKGNIIKCSFVCLLAQKEENYIIFSTSEGYIIIMECDYIFLNNINFQKNLKPQEKLFYIEKAHFKINDLFYQIISENSRKIIPYLNQDKNIVTKFSCFRIHDNEILDFKVIFNQTSLILTISSDNSFKITTFSGNLMLEIKLTNFERMHWDLDRLTSLNRIERFEKTKPILNEIFKKCEFPQNFVDSTNAFNFIHLFQNSHNLTTKKDYKNKDNNYLENKINENLVRKLKDIDEKNELNEIQALRIEKKYKLFENNIKNNKIDNILNNSNFFVKNLNYQLENIYPKIKKNRFFQQQSKSQSPKEIIKNLEKENGNLDKFKKLGFDYKAKNMQINQKYLETKIHIFNQVEEIGKKILSSPKIFKIKTKTIFDKRSRSSKKN